MHLIQGMLGNVVLCQPAMFLSIMEKKGEMIIEQQPAVPATLN
jgi:hypothetical protein